MWYQKIKEYYDKGLWNITMVRNAVIKGKISAEEFVQITGDKYQ